MRDPTDGTGCTTIAELWALYERRVLAPDAPIIQRKECRRAFYSAIRGWIDMMMAVAEEGDAPTQADMDWMDARDAELQEFARWEIATWNMDEGHA